MCQHNSIKKEAFKTFKSTMGNSNTNCKSDTHTKNLKHRRKIWDLEHIYHCAVIGTCLTLEETRKLVGNFIPDTHGMSDYDFHTTAVHMVSYNDKPAKKFQNFLDRKFKKSIQNFKKMDYDQIRQHWRKVLHSGDVISTFWSLITHPQATAEMIKDAYGDIHMMSHLSGAGIRADINNLKRLQVERNELKDNCNLWQQRYQEIVVEKEGLRKELSQQLDEKQHALLHLKQTQNALESMQAHNSHDYHHQLEQQIDKLKQELEHIKQNNHKLKERVIDLESQLEDTVQQSIPNLHSNNKVQEQKIINSKPEVIEDCNDCEFGKNQTTQNLCGRCILYVGGRSRLVPHFKS